MLQTPCSEVVWSVLATHSIRQFPLHFHFHASPCAITLQLDSTYVCMPVCVHTWCPTILCSQHTEIWAPLCNMSQMSVMSFYLHCNMIWLLSFAKGLKEKVISRHSKCIPLNTDCLLATLLKRARHGQNTAKCGLRNIKSQVQCWTKIKYQNFFLDYAWLILNRNINSQNNRRCYVNTHAVWSVSFTLP
jgi:hypothetical protein